MRVSVGGAGSNNFQIQNETVDGLYISVTSTTIGDVSIADLETIQLNVNLQRAGQTTQILAGNAFALGQANNPGSYEGNAIGDYKSFFIPFGGPINVKGTDVLNCVFSVGTSNTGQVTTMTSHNAVGIEFYTPVVTQFPINKLTTSQSLQFGNNVTGLSIVNTSTANVITDVSANCDLWQCNYDVSVLFALMSEQWTRTPEFYAFQLFNEPSAPADNFNATLTVNTSAPGNCYVVCYGGVRSALVTEKAVKLNNKIAAKVATKYT